MSNDSVHIPSDSEIAEAAVFLNENWVKDKIDALTKISTLIEEQGKAGNESVSGILKDIAPACSLHFLPEDKLKPFQPTVLWANGSRSFDIGDFTDRQLDLFIKIAPALNTFWLKARLADILWQRRRKPDAAEMAITAYTGFARSCTTEKDFFECLKALERAVRLVRNTGQGKKYYDQMRTLILGFVDQQKGLEEPKYIFLSKLLRILIEIPEIDSLALAGIAEGIAHKSEESGDWQWEQDFWEIACDYFKKADTPEKSRNASINAAETLVRRGESVSGQPMVAISWLSQAIEYFRHIGNCKERVTQLHSRIIELQRDAPKGFSPVKGPEIDISESVQISQDSVSGKKLLDALFTLTSFAAPPHFDEMRERALKRIRKFPIQNLFSKIVVSADGRTTAVVPAAFGQKDPDSKAVWESVAFETKLHHDLRAQGNILPAMRQIYLEHDISSDELFRILSNSPFIPQGREFLFARGFYQGFNGEWAEALHLLVPQVENSIRYLLANMGVIVSKFDKEGIQDVKSLNDLLEEPKLVEMLGKDSVLDLQILLIDRLGHNLRNVVAHGLVSTNECYSLTVVYFWAVALRLCLMPIMNYLTKREDDKSSEKPEEMTK